MLSDLLYRLRALFRRGAVEVEMDDELRAHLERQVEKYVQSGLSPDEARRRARLEFGGLDALKEECRDARGVHFLETTLQDIRYGLRQLRRSPGFTVVAVLTLALGIGANSAVFSAIDAILLRPLPFPDGDQLMEIQQTNPKARGAGIFVAPSRLEDWNRMNSTFQGISGYYTQDVSETSGDLPQKVTEAIVAPRFLRVLGTSPTLGRDFTPEEERFGGPAVVLVSDHYWRRRFDADPSAVGKKVQLGKDSYTIVGVMPAEFTFPSPDVELWFPGPPDAPIAQNRAFTWYTAIGRLKFGVGLAQARSDLRAVQDQLGKEFPNTDAKLTVNVVPLKDTVVASVGATLWLLFGAVSLLLLIVCTNLAALLLVRGAERQQEIGIRSALGAPRGRLVVQLLTEVFLLALLGGGLGLVVAYGGSQAFRVLAGTLPRVGEIKLDWSLVAYTLGCAVAATFVCGLVPALRASRLRLSESLAQGSRTQVSHRNPWHWVLVCAQVALAVTLLDAAGLLLRSFQALGRVSPGFDSSHILTLHISGGWGETADMKALTSRIDRTLEFLRSVPGVEATATSGTLPGVPTSHETELKLTPQPMDDQRKTIAESRFVSPGYFSTMRIPLLDGEFCHDSAGPAGVVVNRSFVETYLAGASPMGRQIQTASGALSLSGSVVGMVADAREAGINHAPVPTVYWCVSAPNPDPYYLIRTRGEPMALAKTLRRKIHEIEPGRSVFDVETLDDHLDDAFAENRLRTLLLSLFAASAVSLACIGLYGTLSYFVHVRRREVAVRLALGEAPRAVVRRFLAQGLRVSLLGCVAGLGLGAVASRLLSGMLFGVLPSDITTYAAVILLVLTVTAGASLLPAVRAARVEPMRVLREE